MLGAQQRGRRRTEPAADRPVGRGQADRLLAGQPQIPAGPDRRRLGPHPMAGQPGPETRIGEQPADRHRDEPVLVAGRIDGDHPDQMIVGDHPGAGHPRPRRAALPRRRRRRGHVQVQSARLQLPQRGQLPVQVRGIPHPVRPSRGPREPHRRARHRITARQLSPAQHRLLGRRPPALALDHDQRGVGVGVGPLDPCGQPLGPAHRADPQLAARPGQPPGRSHAVR